MLEKWRLLDTGHCSAARNMALDDVILKCRASDLIPNTVHFLQFDPPAVLVGYHQDVEHEVRLDYVRRKHIDVNRRVTGGGALYFDRTTLGWEVIASKRSIACYRGMEALFETMCKGPVHALNTLGIRAAFRPKNDIEVDGRKISGTGGVEWDNAFLFQGTLLVDFDVETMIRALRIPIVKLKDKELKSAKERVTCIRWELDCQPTLRTIKDALRKGFERTFGVKLVNGKLTDIEKKNLRERLSTFQSKDWIFLDRRPENESAVLQAIDKRPGGLIRVCLALDRGAGCIKSALITGDFFTFPSRAILDLEAALKFTPSDSDSIRCTVSNFFATHEIEIPGISTEDVTNLIIEAADKSSYEDFGVSLEEVNHLYPVTKHSKKVLSEGCDFMFLPYCAKPPFCNYREVQGCAKCGKCSFGEVYELAESAGLIPVTIQNFEHLMETLKTLKKRNARGYIGCCCNAFYCKHRDDLEEAGVPGLIVDIDDRTCYDLGKMEDAYRGKFEAQTQLKVELVSDLLSQVKQRKMIAPNVVKRCRASM